MVAQSKKNKAANANFSNNNLKTIRNTTMTKSPSPFIAVSEFTRNPSEALDGLDNTSKTIMRNNQPIGHLIGMDHPLSKILCSSNILDGVKFDIELAFRKGLEEAWRQQFRQMHAVEPTKGAHSIDRLIGVDNLELMRQLPGKDHWTLWDKDGVPALFTMQVYGMHMDTHHALRDFCIEHGLVYWTEKRSWHNPGVSTLIIIEKAKERR
jgi:hypothetical protein